MGNPKPPATWLLRVCVLRRLQSSARMVRALRRSHPEPLDQRERRQLVGAVSVLVPRDAGTHPALRHGRRVPPNTLMHAPHMHSTHITTSVTFHHMILMCARVWRPHGVLLQLHCI